MNSVLFKGVLCSIFFSLIYGCSQTKVQAVLEEDNVTDELRKALFKSDIRLLVTSSRRVYAPGIASSEQSGLLTTCGSKYVPDTGDVVKNKQEHDKRKHKILFMTNYNKKMAIHCKNKTK